MWGGEWALRPASQGHVVGMRSFMNIQKSITYLPSRSLSDSLSIWIFSLCWFSGYWQTRRQQDTIKINKQIKKKPGSSTWAHRTWQTRRCSSDRFAYVTQFLQTRALLRPSLFYALNSWVQLVEQAASQLSWARKEKRKRNPAGRRETDKIPNFHVFLFPPKSSTPVTVGWGSIGHQHTVCNYTRRYNINFRSSLLSLCFI